MKYFTIEELIYSETALKKKIRNKTTIEVERNLQRLVDNILDPLREAYGKAISVTSGYRNRDINRIIGGVSNSQHTTGCAADISAGSTAENRKLAQLIVSLGLPFDQLIDEKGYAWIHVSVSDKPRKQILRYDGKSYKNIKFNEL